LLLGTCGSSLYFIKSGPVESQTVFPPAAVPAPTSVTTQPPSGSPQIQGNRREGGSEPGWVSLQTGLERRTIPITNDQDQPVETLHIWRLDQRNFRLDVAFDARPKTLEAWQQQTNALVVVNGGFYSVEGERYLPDGLVVQNGQVAGRILDRFEGMLAITGSRAELRWLLQKPYNALEPLQAALQSFPVLVSPGGALGFGPERERYAAARRTVIAQDREGRILFLVAPQGYFTLSRLAAYLTQSDLKLDIAVNLDGGGSTGILVANPWEVIPADRALPFVILVYAR
jgi:hypothetical protein